jgi:hypothetical protein
MARAESPTIDETFELLSQGRARLVLQYFDQHANPVKLEDLTEMVARWEAPEGSAPSAADREQVGDALHEECLPRLADIGLVTYDPDGRMVRYHAEAITTAMANARTVVGFVWSVDGDADGDLDEYNLTDDDSSDE